jgi:hypothetical protein
MNASKNLSVVKDLVIEDLSELAAAGFASVCGSCIADYGISGTAATATA